jgi:ribosomal protein S21|tara:strand:- start:905 stop:1090 length:186 start_codon:yes stop_codon:yes gene_type:complete
VIYVKVYNNNIEKALSKFKKQVKESKLLVELREREFFTKKSTKRKELKAKARLRMKNNSNN